MILEPKHKNFKDEYKIKVRVKTKINIRRHMSILVAFELHYFQELLIWWHSPFKLYLFKIDEVLHTCPQQIRIRINQLPLEFTGSMPAELII